MEVVPYTKPYAVMLQPVEPSEVIPSEQVTVAVVAVTLLEEAAFTVGAVVQEEEDEQVVTQPE